MMSEYNQNVASEILEKKEFLICRHGESQANKDGVLAGGGVDCPLSSKGRKDPLKLKSILERMAKTHHALMPDHIVHTGLIRTKDSVSIINEIVRLPVYEEVMLKDRFWGSLEGVPKALYPDAYPDEHPMTTNPPEGETREAFYKRFKANAAKILSKTERGQHPMLMVHKSGVRCLVDSLGYEVQDDIANCAMLHFKPKKRPLMGEFPWEVTKIGLDINNAVVELPVSILKVPHRAHTVI